MEPQIQQTGKAKNLFLNLGAVIALYTVIVSLLNLLFTIINTVYPQISSYSRFGSTSISWPVATIIIFFPIFILLMWLLEKEFIVNPERQTSGIHRWMVFITLFLAGLTIAIDLITALYYFIDGRELTAGFLLKVLAVFIVAGGVFMYYLSNIRGSLTHKSRNIWRIIAGVIVIGSIVWGFSVLGSPRTQRLIKYDEQKVGDLQNINNQVTGYYSNKGALPKTIEEMSKGNYYSPLVDAQTQKSYEYKKTGDTTYNLCAEFNKASDDKTNGSVNTPVRYPYEDVSWNHPAGYYCFNQTINPDMYRYNKPVPMNYPGI